MSNFKNKTIPLTALCLAWFDALLLWSLRPFWSGIHDMTGSAALAPIVFFVILGVAATSSVLYFIKRNKIFFIASLSLSAVFLGVFTYIFLQVKDMWVNIALEFFTGFFFLLLGALLIFLIFFYPKSFMSKKTWARWSLFGIILLVLLICLIPLGHSFDAGAAVYAVEDEYQIVWTTTTKGIAWVEVDGIKYYDSYNGSAVSQSLVHKVSVPMSALDGAKEYTVYSQKILMREPYDGFLGKTISRQYSFRPVDTSDGLDYYSVSDSHGFYKAAAQAALQQNADNKLDFLIICGDTSSYLRTYDDYCVQYLAAEATKGEFPIIYARGNHEPKGVEANDLHRFVGTSGDNFYYTFKLGAVWGVVLDLGEDHNDDWWEYYGTADFTTYRLAQLNFLKEINSNPQDHYGQEGILYRIALCHIPAAAVTRSEIKEAQASSCQYTLPLIKQLWVQELNKMDIDIMVSGHTHQLMYYPVSLTPFTYLDKMAEGDVAQACRLTYQAAYTGTADYANYYSARLAANFPCVVSSRRSDAQKISVAENLFGKKFIGALFSYNKNLGCTALTYTDSKGNVVQTVLPFTAGSSVFAPSVDLFKVK